MNQETIEQRLRDVEGDMKALLAHLSVIAVDYKTHQTGDPENPWAYARKVIKRGALNKD